MHLRKSDKSDQPDEQKALEERVDNIMNQGGAKAAAKPETFQEKPTAEPAPLSEETSKEPAEDKKTAPDLPDDLLKTIKIDKKHKKAKKQPEAPPIVIALADEPPAELKDPKSETEAEAPADHKAEEPALASTAAPDPAELDSVDLDDSDTDQAVEEIIAKEGNTQLAVEDALAARHRAAASAKPKSAFAEVFFNKWTWITILAIVALAMGFFLLLSGF